MVASGKPYQNPEGYLYLQQKRKLGLVKKNVRQIEKYHLTPDEIGFCN